MTFVDAVLSFLNGDAFGCLLYAAEIVIAVFIFGVCFRKRSHFVLRLCLTLVLFLALSTLLALVFNEVFPYLKYIISFVLALALLPACFKANWWDELFCTIAAVLIQNLSYSCSSIVVAFCGWDPAEISFSSAAVSTAIYVVVHIICYFICLRKIKAKEGFGVERISLMILAIILIVMVYVLQYNRNTITASEYFPWRCVFIIFDILTLFMFFSMYDKGQLKRENEILDQMQRNAAMQYEMEQQSIDVINIKCHDLKNQIASIRSLDIKDRDNALSEAEKAVMIYGAIAKTGSKSLDVLLSNKYLVCEKDGIRLTYTVDGDSLGFMDPVDIFSLFGNALDNAIHAVESIEDAQKRVISMECRRHGNFLFILVENYFEGKVKFQDGLPVTSQKNTKVHGYGMLSMKRITEEYGGVMDVEFKNNIFSLSITIPVPSGSSAEYLEA